MKVLNYGSLNIDNVYYVEHIAAPGETVSSLGMRVFAGGKGLNQSLAISRAGVNVYHAANIGANGLMLKELLEAGEVDCTFLRTVDRNTGSAFIQVGADGQNSIVLDEGANGANSEEFIREVLENFSAGDMLLLQNEINMTDRIIDLASEREMTVVLNPSPMNGRITACDLGKIDMFIMNETEGMKLSGCQSIDRVAAVMSEKYPRAEIVLTLGENGSVYRGRQGSLIQPAYSVQAVDTTAAGDTFTGYFIASLVEGHPLAECLDRASKAAALAVTKKGAADSIPYIDEVLAAKL